MVISELTGDLVPGWKSWLQGRFGGLIDPRVRAAPWMSALV